MLDLNLLSETILLAVKKQEDYEFLRAELAKCPLEILHSLEDDNQKKAFWVNIYNAFYQISAKENPNIGKSIYTLKNISVASLQLSLDNIEHDILRKGKYKYSLGYFKSIFRKRVFKKLSPSYLDYRIHFALNCGAVSCPPIAFYSPDNLNEQLDLAANGFLTTETEIDLQTKTVHLSRLFLWFYEDFGGKKGICRIINQYLNQSIDGYRLKYRRYNWTQNLRYFR